MAESTFTLREVGGISFYSCSAFEKLPGLYHGFSTRNGGVQNRAKHSFNLGYTAWDAVEQVDENRRRFLSALKLHETQLVTLRQVHSKQVHIIKEFAGQWNPPDGDGLICRDKNITLAVQTADCIPILIADPGKKVFAAVHSGWRGTLKQIALHAIRKIQNTYGSNPGDLLVAVGPGIRSCCYEVGREVADLFEQKYPGVCPAVSIPGRSDKYLLDLPKALRIQFRTSGIHPENVHNLDLCTCCNTETFFSYRAEGARSGRMMAAIGRTQI
jgi:YfiH family protein